MRGYGDVLPGQRVMSEPVGSVAWSAMGESETLAAFVIVLPVGIWGRRFTTVAVEVGVTVGVGWGSGWLCAVGARRGGAGTEAVTTVQAQMVVQQLVVEELAKRSADRAASRRACQCRQQGSGGGSKHRAAGAGHDAQACADLHADARTRTSADPGG